MPALGGVRRVLRLVRQGGQRTFHGVDGAVEVGAVAAQPVPLAQSGRQAGEGDVEKVRGAARRPRRPDRVREQRNGLVEVGLVTQGLEAHEQGAAEVRRPSGTTGGTHAGARDRLAVQRDGLGEVVPVPGPVVAFHQHVGEPAELAGPVDVGGARGRHRPPGRADRRVEQVRIAVDPVAGVDRRRQVRQAQRQIGRVGAVRRTASSKASPARASTASPVARYSSQYTPPRLSR